MGDDAVAVGAMARVHERNEIGRVVAGSIAGGTRAGSREGCVDDAQARSDAGGLGPRRAREHHRSAGLVGSGGGRPVADDAADFEGGGDDQDVGVVASPQPVEREHRGGEAGPFAVGDDGERTA